MKKTHFTIDNILNFSPLFSERQLVLLLFIVNERETMTYTTRPCFLSFSVFLTLHAIYTIYLYYYSRTHAHSKKNSKGVDSTVLSPPFPVTNILLVVRLRKLSPICKKQVSSHFLPSFLLGKFCFCSRDMCIVCTFSGKLLPPFVSNCCVDQKNCTTLFCYGVPKLFLLTRLPFNSQDRILLWHSTLLFGSLTSLLSGQRGSVSNFGVVC